MKDNFKDYFMMFISDMAEIEITRCRNEGRCVRCRQIFPDPEKEFKILKNPLTGETKRSIYCNICRPLNLEQFKEGTHRDYKEIEYLLKRTGFIEEVTRLCIELKQKLPEIYPLFNLDTIDETIRRYTSEFRRHKQYGGMF